MVKLRNLLLSLLFLLSSVFFIYPGTGNAQATVVPGTESSGYFFFAPNVGIDGRRLCVGGSGSDSKVGLWKCANIDRYKWEIHSSKVPGWYYLVNAGNGKCLSRWSRGNRIRYYGFREEPCKQSDYRLWKFVNHLNGVAIDPQDLGKTLSTTDLLLKLTPTGCLSSQIRPPSVSSRLSVQSCTSGNNYPVDNRIFAVSTSFPPPLQSPGSSSGERERIGGGNRLRTTEKLAQ